jgi:hypothetical protein
MSSQMTLTALSSLLSLLGICYLFFWRYRTFRVDYFRQELFELRDELFDFADEGNLDFNHPAYGILRSTLNGYIRFGHRLTLWHAIFLGIFLQRADKDEVKSFDKVWENSIKHLDASTTGHLVEYRKRMDKIAFRHFLISAPECFILFPFMLIVATAFVVWKLACSVISEGRLTVNAWETIQCRFSEIDSAALVYGEQVTT